MFIRDPRFSNETLEYFRVLAQNPTPPNQTFEVDKMRQFYEDMHEKSNAKLVGTFKGNLEERIVKTNSAGRLSF